MRCEQREPDLQVIEPLENPQNLQSLAVLQGPCGCIEKQCVNTESAAKMYLLLAKGVGFRV